MEFSHRLVRQAQYSQAVSPAAGTELATPRPAPLRVPSQLFDDTPAAAELVLPLKGRRVGVYRQLFEDAAPEVVRACRNAVDLMKEHGCEASCLCLYHRECQTGGKTIPAGCARQSLVIVSACRNAVDFVKEYVCE